MPMWHMIRRPNFVVTCIGELVLVYCPCLTLVAQGATTANINFCAIFRRRKDNRFRRNNCPVPTTYDEKGLPR